MWDALGYLLTGLLFLLSIFLILLILVQRGKGGGLVGALGGMGGQSAFGAKAGGIFWATSIAAGVWILLCVCSVLYNSAGTKAFAGASGANAGRLKDAPSAVEPVKDGTAPAAGTGTATPPAAGTGSAAPPSSGTPAATTQGEVSSDKDFADQNPAPPGDAAK